MSRSLVALVAVTLVACGGSASSSSSSTESTAGTADSAGGESGAQTTEPPRASAGPTVLAVPLPGIGRDYLRPELQELWTRIEVAVAITPPDLPVVATEDAIAAWISGPYTDWVRRRYLATREAFVVTNQLTELTDAERGFAVALVAYAYEDMAASVRGAPVPESIAGDSHLISIFSEAIDRALLPIAQEAAIGYEGCAQIFGSVAEPSWGEWAPYCAQHLADLREVFGRYAQPAPAQTEPAPAAEPEPAPASARRRSRSTRH